MSKKLLYALTGEDVSILKDALHGPLIGMTFTGGPRVPRIAHAANALTPLDHDAAVERMARGLMEHWRDMHTNEALGQQRMLARAALDALLGGEQE